MSVRKTAGLQVRAPTGYTAFVPNPLPPEVQWGPKLILALSDADRALGRLAGEGSKLPNPHVLIRPFIAREAVLSSRIEGTQATLGEILAVQAGAVVERSPDDLREVSNYVVALDYGIKRLENLPLSLRLIRELHEHLMAGVRGDHATPGEFRRTQNWIGTPGCTLATASYVPPPPDQLEQCLSSLELFLHDRTLPPLAQIAFVHYQFEAIHPFLDGNGRVGRLLITLFLIERGILPAPLLYLSAFFEATRQSYYGLLMSVTESSNWEDWLQYFFNGVARQAEDAISRAQRISHLLAQWRIKTASIASALPLHLVEQLAANPFIKAKTAATTLKVAFSTIQRAIEKLEDLDIIEKVGESKRDRVYCAKAILDILEEPAHLVRLSADPQN